jgi:Trypsin
MYRLFDRFQPFVCCQGFGYIAPINGPYCGVNSDDRIINGNLTKLFELPWMALLSYQARDGSRSFMCGGTLISPRYVLTAAHCIAISGNAKVVSVRLGEHDLSKNEDCEEYDDEKICSSLPQDIDVESVLTHPDFDKATNGNDIALVRLAENANIEDGKGGYTELASKLIGNFSKFQTISSQFACRTRATYN